MQQVSINNDQIKLTSLNYGAVIQGIEIKDREGNLRNCVAHYKDPKAYQDDPRFMGACVGRFAGRIAGGRFKIDAEQYELHTENGVHLHGGQQGLGHKYWDVLEVDRGTNPYVIYGYTSPHMEEGYPGELQIRVKYQLKGRTLGIRHEAISDKKTIINLTNHSYFQLDDSPSIDALELKICANKYLETDKNLVPTGKLIPVQGTKYDFRASRPLQEARFDTPYAIDSVEIPQAVVYSRKSGIQLSVRTNQPSIIVYTPEDIPAICLETQHYPDAPNQPTFPSCLVVPGETYINESFFTFDLLP